MALDYRDPENHISEATFELAVENVAERLAENISEQYLAQITNHLMRAEFAEIDAIMRKLSRDAIASIDDEAQRILDDRKQSA